MDESDKKLMIFSRFLFISFFCCFLVIIPHRLISQAATAARARETPGPVLRDSDIEKFLHDFPLILQEIDQLSDNAILSGFDLLTVTFEDLTKNERIYAVFRAYRWDEAFFQRFQTIANSFTILEQERSVHEARQDLGKAFDEIDCEPALNENQKIAMKEQYESMVVLLENMIEPYRRNIHEADIRLVKRFEREVRAAFDNF